MASGIARGRVRTTESRNIAALLQLVACEQAPGEKYVLSSLRDKV